MSAITKLPPKRWLTLDEAADYVGANEKTVRRYVAQGRLTGYRMGTRALRFDVADLDALMRPIPAGGGANA